MLHKILKDFKGSQDGRFTEQFKADTTVELTPYLADIAVREGWAQPVEPAADGVENKAVATDGSSSRTKRVRKAK